ncbi:MAG: DUF2971 domain-containing protein [Alphaproteobacteria bacterium]|nr:DUF2971 domain-containing protein [Alphaproteobacteria bacterium]
MSNNLVGISSDYPEVIYRYQKFNALTIDALCNDQLYFSDPSNFNDPLDCKPSVKQNSDKAALRSILKSLIWKRVREEMLRSLKAANMQEDKAISHAEEQADQAAYNELRNISYHATNPDYECSIEEVECGLLTSAIQYELLKQNNRGVCCFSSEYANPLLWSHYGDQHQGFCIGYSLDRNPKPIINQVVYGGVRTIETSLIHKAILEDDKDAQKVIDENIFLRKAEPWNYEREWRIFDGVGLKYSPLRLEEITFGLRCPNAVVHSVMTSLEGRSKPIKFYRMHTVSDSFKLERTNEYEVMYTELPRESISAEEAFG